MTKNKFRQFISQLEFIGKQKNYTGRFNNIAKSFSFKDVNELLKDKKTAYDFEVSQLFDKYYLDNDDLFEEFDKMWKEAVELGKRESMKQACIAAVGIGTGIKMMELEIVMKSYINKTYKYCSDFARSLINE